MWCLKQLYNSLGFCPVQSNMILYFTIIIVVIVTLKLLKNQSIQRTNTNDTELITRLMFKSLAQFIILGCYWILLYIPSDNGVLYNVFLFLNSQQGTFIFIVHCLLNQEVRTRLITTNISHLMLSCLSYYFYTMK